MEGTLVIKAAAIVVAALLFSALYLHLRRQEAGKREHMLDGIVDRLDGVTVGRSPWGYATVDGILHGHRIHASLFPDSLVTRTLPTLWLEMSWDLPQDGWLCVVLDANGMEYFADEVDQGTRIQAPAAWPNGMVVRGTDQRSLALAQRIGRVDLRQYRDLKLVLLNEGQIKVVMRCGRADMTYYRVLRAADFAGEAVSAELAGQTINALRDIERALVETEEVA